MLFTDTGDYHWGTEGLSDTQERNIGNLSDQVSHQRALSGSIFIANIHYATNTVMSAKRVQGRNAQDGKEQKKQMVYLKLNFIELFL